MENVYREKAKNFQFEKFTEQSLKEKYKNIEFIRSSVSGCTRFNAELEILKYLNSGSCGTVYEGKIRRSPTKNVALKFILNKMSEKMRNEKEKEKIHNRIAKEINIQKKLKHKNITSLYNVYPINNEGICIVMELAKYGDLDYFQKKLIKQKNLSETLIAYITKQILNALFYCHQSKIIHMDIKHQNILIDENLQIKLADLSVSYSYSSFPKNSMVPLTLAGTSLFMSPEVLAKKEVMVEECNKIDMYSLGSLLFNLAFAQYPYGLDFSDKKNFEKIKEKISKNELIIPNVNKQYSLLFKNFISRLLHKDIHMRLSIREALDHPWIKGADLIFHEKEKIYVLEKFLINLVTDTIKPFNDYIHSMGA